MYKITKRIFDIIFATVGILVFFPILVVVAISVKLTSPGGVIYWSDRIGVNNTIFKMPKFRTMRLNTPSVATHLLEKPETYLTPIGSFLRKTSLDELPQFYSILKGDMSVVGPRPALYNQYDLIKLRTENGIHMLLPGMTGWAQVNGRDDISIKEKVAIERVYLQRNNFFFDVRIILITIRNVISGKGISH